MFRLPTFLPKLPLFILSFLVKKGKFNLINRRLWVFLLGIMALNSPVFAQVNGGQHSFTFLRFSPSARITALGGALPMVQDDDPTLGQFNPAALNEKMHHRATVQHQFHIGGIQTGYMAYARTVKQIKSTVHLGVQYIGYGDIPLTDEYGAVLADMQNTEYAITAGAGRRLTERLTLGLNLRFAGSKFDVFSSTALGMDAGLMYVDTAAMFTAALVLKNAGAQLSTYTGTRESIPYDLQLGLSKRLKYLPFRLGLVAHHLHQWDIRYDDPALRNQDNFFIFGEEETESKGTPFVDNLFRHLIFNGEFLLGTNEAFKIRVGYNHLRKRELSVTNYRSLAGFSGGVGFGIRRFRVDVGYGAWHLAGGNFHLGLGLAL